MKKVAKFPAAVVIAATLLFTACNGTMNKEHEQALSTKEQQIAKEKAANDSLEMAFAQTLSEIDQNLDQIREKEGTLILGPGSNVEQGISKQEHIKRNISIINSLMEQNKEKLKKLTAQLKKSKSNNALLTKLAEGTKERLAKQEEEIAMLKTQLADKTLEVEQLNGKLNDAQLANAILQDKADKLDKDVYSAFYTVGSYDKLKKENLVTKQGGVFGIGKKKALNTEFKKDNFTQIDARQTTQIPVNAKKVKLITSHPRSSFALTKEKDKITYIEIKNPDEFWKTSKYLVVEVQI